MSVVQGNIFKISFTGSRGAGPVSVPDLEEGDSILLVRRNGAPVVLHNKFEVDTETGILNQITDTDLSVDVFDLIVFRAVVNDEPAAPVEEPAASPPETPPEETEKPDSEQGDTP